jgi:hypothetical protein
MILMAARDKKQVVRGPQGRHSHACSYRSEVLNHWSWFSSHWMIEYHACVCGYSMTVQAQLCPTIPAYLCNIDCDHSGSRASRPTAHECEEHVQDRFGIECSTQLCSDQLCTALVWRESCGWMSGRQAPATEPKYPSQKSRTKWILCFSSQKKPSRRRYSEMNP